MPQNRKQEIVYTIIMVICMVYAMVCYNIVLDAGGMKNWIFIAALTELPIMGAAGFILDTFIAGPLAKKFTFRIFNPKEVNPIFLILGISILSIWLMCPMMSFVATILFKGGFNSEMISTWIQLTITNFPMAFFWQLFAAGPFVRKLHKHLISKL